MRPRLAQVGLELAILQAQPLKSGIKGMCRYTWYPVNFYLELNQFSSLILVNSGKYYSKTSHQLYFRIIVSFCLNFFVTLDLMIDQKLPGLSVWRKGSLQVRNDSECSWAGSALGRHFPPLRGWPGAPGISACPTTHTCREAARYGLNHPQRCQSPNFWYL